MSVRLLRIAWDEGRWLIRRAALEAAFFAALLPSVTYAGAAMSDAQAAAGVVILANSQDPGSMRIARHYAGRRSIPLANIVALPMTDAETIAWPQFVGTIWQPLRDLLVRDGWIGAGAPVAPGLDGMGRRRTSAGGHRISYLVICRGVPLRIADAPELTEGLLRDTTRAEMRTNQASVDSELSLLSAPTPPATGFVPNALYGKTELTGWELTSVVKVARLDGPTVEDAIALVDRAMDAERTGLRGRAYFDLGGAHPSGDAWLDGAAAEVARLGYDTDVERSPATLRSTARADAAAFYFGWYAAEIDGPFALPGYRFPPGAIAMHIHSYSAETLRSATRRWAGPLVARGVTATVGNVWEPYLEYTHHPDLLMRALAQGERWGNAAYFALPVLSWQAVTIGDPLYRPMRASLASQLSDRSADAEALRVYAEIRQARLLKQSGRQAAASELLRQSFRERGEPAAALALLRELPNAASLPEGRVLLGGIRWSDRIAASEWAIAAEVAQQLAAGGSARAAMALYARLLEEPAVPRELRLAWLDRARRAATAAGDAAQAEAWARAMVDLEAGP